MRFIGVFFSVVAEIVTLLRLEAVLMRRNQNSGGMTNCSSSWTLIIEPFVVRVIRTLGGV